MSTGFEHTERKHDRDKNVLQTKVVYSQVNINVLMSLGNVSTFHV